MAEVMEVAVVSHWPIAVIIDGNSGLRCHIDGGGGSLIYIILIFSMSSAVKRF